MCEIIMEFTKVEDINIDLIELDKPTKINNVYYSNINYKNRPLIVQVGRITINEDLSSIHSKSLPSIEFEIPEKNMHLYDFFISLDERNINETYNNESKWFLQSNGKPKNIPKNIIDDMYKRISKPLQSNKLPTIRFKLPVKNGSILIQSYNQNKTTIPLEKIPIGTECTCILHIRGLKFLKQHYICDCYISQIKSFVTNITKYSIPTECVINDSNDTDDLEHLDSLIDDIIDKSEINNIELYNSLTEEMNEINNQINGKIIERKQIIDKLNQL